MVFTSAHFANTIILTWLQGSIQWVILHF